MNKKELKSFLKALTVKALKNICSNDRRSGVYHSETNYPGYSKCKNKGELVEFIYNTITSQTNNINYSEEYKQWFETKEFYNYEYNNGIFTQTLIFTLKSIDLPKHAKDNGFNGNWHNHYYREVLQ